VLSRRPPDDPGQGRERDDRVQQADAWPPREIDGRQTGLNVPANLRTMGGEAPLLRAGRTTLDRGRLERRDDPLPAGRIDDVDGVVTAIGARHPEEEGEPPPEAEPAFMPELAFEDERPSDLLEIDARLLLDSVHEDVEGIAHGVG
jgi:hypothetical protein